MRFGMFAFLLRVSTCSTGACDRYVFGRCSVGARLLRSRQVQDTPPAVHASHSWGRRSHSWREGHTQLVWGLIRGRAPRGTPTANLLYARVQVLFCYISWNRKKDGELYASVDKVEGLHEIYEIEFISTNKMN